jgi:cytochrome o ubiquinol oxidase operon protein cyoD
MQSSPHSREVTPRPYLVGVVLALLLTAIPFAAVAARALPPASTFAVIAVAAIVQIVVHLRFFLRLDLKPSSQEKLVALCFAAVLIVIMAGGSLWIMFDLQYRMM